MKLPLKRSNPNHTAPEPAQKPASVRAPSTPRAVAPPPAPEPIPPPDEVLDDQPEGVALNRNASRIGTEPERSEIENTGFEDVPVIAASSALALDGAADVEGHVEARDILVPRLNLVQRMSDLASQFQPGSLVFSKTMRLCGLNEGYPVAVLRLRKQYQRWYAEYDPDRVAERYDHPDQVRAANGHFNYGVDGYFEEVAHILVAIPCPEDATEVEKTLFGNEGPDGNLWALGILTVSGTGFTDLAKPLLSYRFGQLRTRGFTAGLFNLKVIERKNKKYSWAALKAELAGLNSAEMSVWLDSLHR